MSARSSTNLLPQAGQPPPSTTDHSSCRHTQASPQVEPHLLSQSLRRARFRFPKHRLAQNPSVHLPSISSSRVANTRIVTVIPRTASSVSMARAAPAPTAPASRLSSQSRALLRVPCHSSIALQKSGDRQSWIAPRRSRCLSLGLEAVFVPRGDISVSLARSSKNLHAAQIHFVSLQDRADPARHQPRRFP